MSSSSVIEAAPNSAPSRHLRLGNNWVGRCCCSPRRLRYIGSTLSMVLSISSPSGSVVPVLITGAPGLAPRVPGTITIPAGVMPVSDEMFCGLSPAMLLITPPAGTTLLKCGADSSGVGLSGCPDSLSSDSGMVSNLSTVLSCMCDVIDMIKWFIFWYVL